MPFTINGTNGLTFPDSTTQATRAVSRAGGETISGPITLETTGVAFRTRIGTADESSAMAAGQTNNVITVNAPFGANPAAVNNATAKWGIKFTGWNQTVELNSNSKSAGVYAVSEEEGAGYNRRVGLALHTSDFDQAHREVMRLDGFGRVRMPFQPAFRSGFTSAFDTTVTSGGAIPFNNAPINIGGHFNTSNNRFTAPVAGRYLFHTHVYATMTSVGNYNGGVGFLVNGSRQSTSGGDDMRSDASIGDTAGRMTIINLNTTAILNLAAGDFVQVFGLNYSGAGSSFAYYRGSSFFQGYLIG
jgi:hypothetical protein